MSKLELIHATAENGIWKKLSASWDKQLKQHSAPAEWAAPFMEHASKIVEENGKDDRYAIYVACGPGGKPPFEGFVHINFKLMKTSGAEIRLVWNRLAPRFQFEDLRDQVSEVQSTFLIDSLKISAAHQRQPPVKMFLGNPIDLSFGRSFAQISSRIPAMRLNAAVRGNWLHISRLSG